MNNEQKFYMLLLKEPYMTDMDNHRQYELNKTYTARFRNSTMHCGIFGYPAEGFYCFDETVFIAPCYNKKAYDIFEVIPDGEWEYLDYLNQFCVEKITIIRQLSDEEIHNMIPVACVKSRNNINITARFYAVKYGRIEDLDVLINDESWEIRRDVAYYGHSKHLDILVNDKNETVRSVVAMHGRPQDLDILVNDNEYCVRKEVAKHGRDKNLDILVNDIYWAVRYEVAKHGRDKDLDILINDGDNDVRKEVAKHGRGKDLDILVNDIYWKVRREVARCGRPRDLDKLIHDDNDSVKLIVVAHGRPQDLEIIRRAEDII